MFLYSSEFPIFRNTVQRDIMLCSSLFSNFWLVLILIGMVQIVSFFTFHNGCCAGQSEFSAAILYGCTDVCLTREDVEYPAEHSFAGNLLPIENGCLFNYQCEPVIAQHGKGDINRKYDKHHILQLEYYKSRHKLASVLCHFELRWTLFVNMAQ